MRLLTVILVALVACVQPALARGGGGCLKEGTPILTPAGERTVQSLHPGDTVLSDVNGTLMPAIVRDVIRVDPEQYWILEVGGHRLELTGEHPVQTAPGEFCSVSHLQVGERVILVSGGKISSGVVGGLGRASAACPAWNLLVSPGGTFIGAGIVVHNKGCFLPDTPIRLADGSERPISRIRPGDTVLAFNSEGDLTRAPVEQVLTHDVSRYCVVQTDTLTLKVTPEHPFFIGAGRFKTLESLKSGDAIYVYDGGRLQPQPIRHIAQIAEPVRVYNLHTAPPNTFLAHGAAVHNKGGGGGHGGGHSSGHYSRSGSGRGGSGSPVFALVFIGIVVVLVMASAFSGKQKNLDFVYRPSDIAAKRDKTEKLLDFIARQDGAMAPDVLRERVQSVFVRLQECWQAREYEPMRTLMMADLYADHLTQLEGMKRHHEINKIESLQVRRVELVNLRYTHKVEQREFTALITASARDYYVDDRTGRKTRGDNAPATFQEFWTFQYDGRQWVLREIEQSGESQVLKEDNLFEPFTETGVNQVYGSLAGNQGPAGPWLEKTAAGKETRIERLLNFLVQTDPVWNRTLMHETARRVFLSVMAGLEAGEASVLSEGDLFPDLLRDLQSNIAENQAAGLRMEFRNLCVRKVELVLVRNLDDNGEDEFVARIRAHAQRIVTRGTAISHQDDDVTPFDQYLTLGRLRQGGSVEKRWRLKEWMSSGEAASLVDRENQDQDTSPEMLKWYYGQKRAN